MRGWNASLCMFALVIGLGGSLDPARAQSSYPNRTITVVVPFAPGGSTSIVGRVIADKMSQQMGQGIVIDHRPGAGGTVGTKAVAKSEPDGYTLLLGYTGTLAIGPSLYKNPGYDPRKDFAPIGMIGNAPASLGEDRADARQRHPRHQHVEQDEGQRQPKELRREMLRLERRKGAVSAFGRSAMGGRLGHDGASEPEQKQESDQQRENAERLGDGEAENQIAELALRGGRIAQSSRQVIAEDDADADAGAAHADTGNAGSNVFRRGRVHGNAPFKALPPFPASGGAPGGGRQWPGCIASLR